MFQRSRVHLISETLAVYKFPSSFSEPDLGINIISRTTILFDIFSNCKFTLSILYNVQCTIQNKQCIYIIIYEHIRYHDYYLYKYYINYINCISNLIT